MVLAVGAVVLRADGAVLLVRRARPPAVGTWTLPGGKVEANETPEQAVVREVKEETELDIAPVGVAETLELTREGFAYRIIDFACRLVGGECPVARDDVSDARWVSDAEVGAFLLTPEVVRVIARAREMLVE
jgi:8-oxo-dGTP diphosphatase